MTINHRPNWWKEWGVFGCVAFLSFFSIAATIVIKISDFPNTDTLNDSDLFLIAEPNTTNKNITWEQLRAQIGTNGTQVFNINTNYTTNSYVTYQYVTNQYVTTNVVNNQYVTENYVTNQYVTTNIVDYSYTTNLFISQFATNYYLFNTNIYNADTYVSNYFTTNVFNDTYMSNFFLTNLIFYETNLYLSYITTTNFLEYITNTYVSNFWNTNIYVNDTYVSNYFTTNYYALYDISSNYIYNVSWPLTNATLWGTTTFSPTNNTSGGRISMYSNNVENVTLDANGGYIKANTIYVATNTWSGFPTGTVALGTLDQYVRTYTPLSITGVTAKSNNVVEPVVMTITNAAASNITVYLVAGIAIPDRTSAFTVSNGSWGIFSLRYHPLGGTNGIWKQW